MKTEREKIRSMFNKCGLIVAIILFASCSNITDSKMTQINELYSDKSTAEIYIETLFSRDELFTTRNVYDMSAGFQVTPAEIANAMQTILITVYNNR